ARAQSYGALESASAPRSDRRRRDAARGRRRSPRRGRLPAVRRIPRAARRRRRARARDDGRGRPPRRRRAEARGGALPRASRRAAGRRPLRRAEHGDDGRARRARRRVGCGRGGRDRAALLRLRRRRAARALRRGRARVPTPFYVYEFAARSGYAVPLDTLARLRDEADNFVGLKVSDTPWDRFEPYLLDGLDIFVGPESLLPQGLAAGAVGAVSGLAASFPDAVVALVRDPTPEHGAHVAALRASLQALPFHAASKMALG